MGWPRTTSSEVTRQRRWRELVPKILDRHRYRCRIQKEGICIGKATVADMEQHASRRPRVARANLYTV